MSRRRPIVLDARALDIPLASGDVTLSDLLQHGTAEEVRDALTAIGLLLKTRHTLPAELAVWLGDALTAISAGQDAGRVLGLNRKRKYGVRYASAVGYMVNDLIDQGLSPDDARDIVGRFDAQTNKLTSVDEAGGKIKKRLQRVGRRSRGKRQKTVE